MSNEVCPDSCPRFELCSKVPFLDQAQSLEPNERFNQAIQFIQSMVGHEEEIRRCATNNGGACIAGNLRGIFKRFGIDIDFVRVPANTSEK